MKLVLLAAALASTPAIAAVDQATLDRVAFAPLFGASLPLDQPFTANGQPTTLRKILDGKPALVLPLDFRCRVTCGPTLSIVAEALMRVSLRPGTDYRFLLLGLNTDILNDEAQSFVAARIGPPALHSAATSLLTSRTTLNQFTSALGYTFHYDKVTRSFAHPLGAVTVTADGSIARLLSPLALDPDNLRLALVEAGDGRIGSWTTKLRLLCYGFDAAHGIYTSKIIYVLRSGCSLVALAIATWIIFLVRRSKHNARAAS